MDKTQLVDSDMQAGRQIIEGLERLGIPIDVAFWLQDDESLDWRLIVSSPSVPKDGPRRLYTALFVTLRDLNHPTIRLEDVVGASPNENRIKDLKRRVGTNDGLHDIRLDGLDLGFQHYRSARVYRVAGGKIGFGAHVVVKATGRQGIVQGRIRAADGWRFLVLHAVNSYDVKFGEELPPTSGGQYAADELEFLYIVGMRDWPDELPDWLLAVTSPNGPNGTEPSLESTG